MSAVVPPPPRSKNGIGITGFALGLLGFALAFVPVVGVISWPAAILGLIFGITGIGRARDGARNGPIAVAGTALAGLTLLVCIAWIGLLGGGAAEVVGNSPARQAAVAGADASAPLRFGARHSWPGGGRVQVSAPHEGHGYPLVSGGRVAEVELTITNDTGHDLNPAGWNITATHGGRPTKPVFTDDQLVYAPIPAGARATLTRGFEVSGQVGELRVSVQPNFLAQHAAHYSGPF